MSIPHQIKKRQIEDPHPTSTIKDVVSGEVVKVHDDQIMSSIEHTQFFNFQPQGAQVVFQNTPAQLDFNIAGAALGEIKFVGLQIPITNTDTTNSLELIPPAWWFNQVQILSSNLILEQMWPEGLFYDMKYMTDEQTAIFARITGNMQTASLTERNVAGGSPIVLGPGARYDYWLIMPATLFQQTKVPLNSIINLTNNNVTFRFYFNTFAQITASANTMTTASNLQVGNMLLWLGGSSIGRNETLPFDGDHSYSFRQHERAIIPLGNQTPNQRLSSTLVNFNGLFSQVTAFIREQGATQEKQFQCNFSGTTYLPAEWATYNSTLYDAANQPYSAVNLPFNIQALAPALIYDNTDVRARCSTFATKFPYVEWDLGGQPWKNHYNGQISGLPLNNNWQIVTYINPNFTTKNAEMVILGDRISELKVKIDKGLVVGVPQ